MHDMSKKKTTPTNGGARKFVQGGQLNNKYNEIVK